MQLVVDTHVHLYPCYNLELTLLSAYKNLKAAALELRDVQYALCLTERSECNFYHKLISQQITLDTITIHNTQQPTRIELKFADQGIVSLFAGRQLVSAERLEVLALNTNKHYQDGMPASELINAIYRDGGIPVLCWSPGKWLGKRGKEVARIILENNKCMVGLTAMLPNGFMLPTLIQKACKLGRKLLYGSDPLPFSGEEELIGRYVTLISSDLKYIDSLTELVYSAQTIRPLGVRSSLLKASWRWFKNNRINAMLDS